MVRFEGATCILQMIQITYILVIELKIQLCFVKLYCGDVICSSHGSQILEMFNRTVMLLSFHRAIRFSSFSPLKITSMYEVCDASICNYSTMYSQNEKSIGIISHFQSNYLLFTMLASFCSWPPASAA